MWHKSLFPCYPWDLVEIWDITENQADLTIHHIWKGKFLLPFSRCVHHFWCCWGPWWAHTTADMQIIPKFTLFSSGWWIEVACVGIYLELLGKWQRCDFVLSHFTWRVEAKVQVRLEFDNIQYFQCSSPHHSLVPTYPQNHTCGMLAQGVFFVWVTAL